MLRFTWRAAAVAVCAWVGDGARAQDALPALEPAKPMELPKAPDAAPPKDAVPVAPDAPALPVAPPADACSACGSVFDWKKVPRVRPTPRIGNFPVLPTGPGYYSALDHLRGECLKAPPKYPYPRFGLIPPSFFDVDNFSYLDDPKNTEHDFFDPLKRIRIGDNWQFTTGGDVRSRFETKYNDRVTERDNNYGLYRTRVYGDLWYRDDFRVFAEYIGAWSVNQDLPRLPIDENKSDLLNAFVDVKVADLGGSPAYVRVGRQELLFGSQRLISPLDWANTRRTFQGVRAFRQTEKWDFDLFWVQPVAINPNKFDSVDNNQNFVGAWGTYRPKKGQTIDAYYLMLDNTNRVTQLGLQRGNFTRHTVGGRYVGAMEKNPNILFDSETAFQFGEQSGRDIFAAMTTQGLGYNFKDAEWNPTVWAYYDYASGGRNGVGTFNQLFPFGHYYLGWIDQVGRQNIHDLNFHLYLYPTKWMTTWVQFHNFWLADRRDALYNAAGNAIRRAPNGGAGQFVGHEIDVVLNFHLSKHADLLMGYSHLFGGEFLRKTSTPTLGREAGFGFAQLSYRW